MAVFYRLREPIAPASPLWSLGAVSSLGVAASLSGGGSLPERSEGRVRHGAGLSKLHIVTDVHPTSGKPAAMAGGGELAVAVGGSFVSLTRSGRSDATKKEKAPRGRVSQWSPKSRMNLRYKLAGLDRGALGRSVFVTLTYPREFPPPEDSKVYKDHLRHFTQALQREIDANCAGFWKLEFQDRGAAHYHLLIVGYEGDLVALREWVARRWYEVVGSGDERHFKAGTQTDAARTVGGALHYLAKYMSKEDQSLPGKFTGRYWGKFNAAALPLAPVKTLNLSDSGAAMVSRWLKRIVVGHVMESRWKASLRASQLLPWDDGWTRLSAERAMQGKPVMTVTRRWKKLNTPDGNVSFPPGSIFWTGSCDIGYRPPRRWRLRANSTVRLIADADKFAAAVQRALERGILQPGDPKPAGRMAGPCGVLP